jgi:23S rRNA (cytosine1962-C5)-methyltransferase
MRRLVLQPGRDVPVRRGHPWIFSRAVREGLSDSEPGEPVRIVAASGAFVAMGYANPRTTIAARVCSLDDEPLDAAFVDRRGPTRWRYESSCCRRAWGLPGAERRG